MCGRTSIEVVFLLVSLIVLIPLIIISFWTDLSVGSSGVVVILFSLGPVQIGDVLELRGEI